MALPAAQLVLCSTCHLPPEWNPALTSVGTGADPFPVRRCSSGVCGRRHGRLDRGCRRRSGAGGVVWRGAALVPSHGARHDAGELGKRTVQLSRLNCARKGKAGLHGRARLARSWCEAVSVVDQRMDIDPSTCALTQDTRWQEVADSLLQWLRGL